MQKGIGFQTKADDIADPVDVDAAQLPDRRFGLALG